MVGTPASRAAGRRGGFAEPRSVLGVAANSPPEAKRNGLVAGKTRNRICCLHCRKRSFDLLPGHAAEVEYAHVENEFGSAQSARLRHSQRARVPFFHRLHRVTASRSAALRQS